MSKLFILWTAGFAWLLTAQTTHQPLGSSQSLSHDQVQKKEYENQKAQLCTYFSQLVGNFLNIAQNPHNSAHVSGNIADILNNVVNIAISCIKRSGLELTEEEITKVMQNLESEFAEYRDVIRAVIIKRIQILENV